MVNSLMTTEHSKTTADQRAGSGTNYPQPGLVVQRFGELPEDLPENQEGLSLTLLPSSLPLKRRWRTNGLSADFLADYLTTFLSVDEDTPETIARRTALQSAVSYIANELLENAMKFSNARPAQPIRICLQLYSEHLVFCVTNGIDASRTCQYQSFIQELLAADPSEMLLQRLEQNIEIDPHQSSGLGLVTIKSDYLAKLGWKFETAQESREITTVTTTVQITL